VKTFIIEEKPDILFKCDYQVEEFIVSDPSR
jgi:signal transduction histidine kinase